MIRTTAAVVALVLLLVSLGARAEPASSASLAEAKKYFEAGMAFHKERRFVEALAAFMEANRLAPRASTQRNIAQTHRDLNDMASAYTDYEVLVATYGDAMKPADKAEVTRALDELAVVTGVVSITVPDAGTMVTVDGKELGPSPRAVRLNIGAHTIRVAKPGFAPIEQAITVAGHDAFAIAGPLVSLPVKGHVAITVEPTSLPATITVDDAELGPAPWSGELESGTHRVFARNAEGKSSIVSLEVTPGGSHAIKLPIARAFAVLKVQVDVLDADITLDGVMVAKSLFEGPIALGRHRLLVSKPDYVAYQRTFDIQSAERVTELVSLVRDSTPVVAPSESSNPGWEGIYGRFDLLGLFPTAEQNNVKDGTVYGPSGKTELGKLLGGGLDFRLGYSFGWVGLEGIARFTYDLGEVSVHDTSAPPGSRLAAPGRTDDWEFHRFGGTFAAGARFMAETVLRPTLGLAAGVSPKSVAFRRVVRDDGTANASDAKAYLTPTILMDAGIELGSRAGTRCFIGAVMHLDLPEPQTLDGSTVTNGSSALPSSTIIRAAIGPEVFVGPVIGLRFGH